MIEVIPAIMPRNFKDLKEKVEKVSNYVSSVQLDLMDGKFVKEKTWPYFSYSDEDFAFLLKEQEGLPFWNKIDYEIDFMSSTPEADVFDWIKIGARRAIIHFESTGEFEKLVSEIRSEFGNPKENPLSPEIGIASSNSTPFSDWEKLIELVDFIQVMGIDRIGYQGEAFDERAIDRIKTLRSKFKELIISVDGGVNRETAPRLVESGANRLVSGSFIFDNPNTKEHIDFLKNL